MLSVVSGCGFVVFLRANFFFVSFVIFVVNFPA